MESLPLALAALTILPSRAFGGLTVFPVVAPPRPSRDYLSLDEALRERSARIAEVDGGGRVPELVFVNDGPRPVLLLDGEELIGAKQNRVLNLTILAPAGKTIRVPVSCVEQGRWSSVSSHFASSDQVMYSMGRAAKAAGVTASMLVEGRPTSRQGEVWRDIDDKARRMGTSSPTGAMSDLYRRHSADVESYVAAFPAEESQCGAIFAIGGAIRGIELFDHPATLRSLLGKLIRSYALDALELPRGAHPSPGADEAAAFLLEIASAETTSHPSVGLGDDVRIRGARLAGGALVLDDRIVHLCVFRVNGRADEPGAAPSGRIMSSGWRSRFRR